MQKAPLAYNLKLNRNYEFKIRSGTFEKMAVVQGDKWLEMDKQDDAFALTLQPALPGQLLVLGKAPGSENYTAILGYEVRP